MKYAYASCTSYSSVLQLLVLVLVSFHGQISCRGADVVPHVDDCNLCQKCLVDEEPDKKLLTIKDLMVRGINVSAAWLILHGTLPQFESNLNCCNWQAELGELRKSLPPPSSSPPPPHGDGLKPRRTKRGRFSDLLEPLDEAIKALKPNCSVCRGCNYELRDISSAEVQFQNIHFTHGAGATSNWMFFASRPGEDRATVKIFCIPIDKRTSLAGRSRHLPMNECSSKTASDRLELLLIQQKMVEECGVQEIFPRVWVSRLSAVMPRFGYHVRWYGVWMEEAKGITLFALHTSRDKKLALRLFQQNLNKTQVLLGAIWDVLTAQCDRHSENIFVDDSGSIQYIDNDKAFGVVGRCGYDSMLLPGNQP